MSKEYPLHEALKKLKGDEEHDCVYADPDASGELKIFYNCTHPYIMKKMGVTGAGGYLCRGSKKCPARVKQSSRNKQKG